MAIAYYTTTLGQQARLQRRTTRSGEMSLRRAVICLLLDADKQKDGLTAVEMSQLLGCDPSQISTVLPWLREQESYWSDKEYRGINGCLVEVHHLSPRLCQ